MLYDRYYFKHKNNRMENGKYGTAKSFLVKARALYMASNIASKDEDFYKDAAKYWSQVPATVNGMLGGFGNISARDIHDSKTLLKQLFSSKQPPGRGYALDCGAGIGRITRSLLSDLFDKVDMVEQNPLFLDSAKNYLGMEMLEKKIGQMFPVGLQDFEPEPKKYDVIWAQWVLGHLTDDDFVKFFTTCQKGLKPNGVIVAKENITSTECVEVDQKDSSVTRPMALQKELFDKAGLDCYRLVKQLRFPKGLYTVYMFVLKPKANLQSSLNQVKTEGSPDESNINSKFIDGNDHSNNEN